MSIKKSIIFQIQSISIQFSDPKYENRILSQYHTILCSENIVIELNYEYLLPTLFLDIEKV